MSTFDDIVSDALPWITTALTSGPVGIAAKAAGLAANALGLSDSSVSGVTTALSNMTLSGEQQVALKQADYNFQVAMKAAGYQDKEAMVKMDLDQIAAINATIVAELQNSDKEAWYQKAWRPFLGFCVGIGSLSGVTGVSYLAYQAIFENNPAALNTVPALAMAIATILAIPGAGVGITAWHRGVAQVEQVKADGATALASATTNTSGSN